MNTNVPQAGVAHHPGVNPNTATTNGVTHRGPNLNPNGNPIAGASATTVTTTTATTVTTTVTMAGVMDPLWHAAAAQAAAQQRGEPPARVLPEAGGGHGTPRHSRDGSLILSLADAIARPPPRSPSGQAGNRIGIPAGLSSGRPPGSGPNAVASDSNPFAARESSQEEEDLEEPTEQEEGKRRDSESVMAPGPFAHSRDLEATEPTEREGSDATESVSAEEIGGFSGVHAQQQGAKKPRRLSKQRVD